MKIRKSVIMMVLCLVGMVLVAQAVPEHNAEYYKGLLTEQYGMQDNESARAPTCDELDQFLQADNTNEEVYTADHNSKWFSTQLHNKLEAAGYKAGEAVVELKGCEGKRVINAIECEDAGEIVYIDDVGTKEGTGVDKLVTSIGVGEIYTAVGLYDCDKTYERQEIKSVVIVW